MAQRISQLVMSTLLFAMTGVVPGPAMCADDSAPPEPFAGTAVFSTLQLRNEPIGAPELDHILRMSTDRSLTVEFRTGHFPRDCSIVRTVACDLTRGGGECHGYAVLEAQEGDRLMAKFSGGMKMPRDGVTSDSHGTFEGIWAFVQGTGRFAGVTGGGTYKGRYTSPVAYTLDWQGEMQRPRPAGGID